MGPLLKEVLFEIVAGCVLQSSMGKVPDSRKENARAYSFSKDERFSSGYVLSLAMRVLAFPIFSIAECLYLEPVVCVGGVRVRCNMLSNAV